MTEDEESSKEGQLPNTNKLRRFSLGVGIALLIYVFAGGEIGESVQTVLTPLVHFKRPWVLLFALFLTSVYSSYQYWYYAIHLAPTRTKTRKYLQSSESVYTFSGPEQFFKDQVAHPNPNETKNFLSAFYIKIPPGVRRDDCIIITHGIGETDRLKQCVANHLERYFTKLKADNITVNNRGHNNWWAHVSSLTLQTKTFCWIEDAELYLPVIVNGLAILALVFYWLWLEIFHVRAVTPFCVPVL